MKYITGFLLFWYDFIIGDDWTIAAAVAAALIVLGLLAHAHIGPWWLLPVVVILALGASVQRVAMKSS